MSSSPEQRNWKGMVIAVLVIGVILSCVAMAVVILTPDQDDANRRGQPFAIRHLVAEEEGGNFKPRPFNGTWLSGKGLSVYIMPTLISLFNKLIQQTSFCFVTPRRVSPYWTLTRWNRRRSLKIRHL